MRDLAEHGSWRDLVVIDLVIVVVLMTVGVDGDGPLIRRTAAVGAPIAFVATAVRFAVVKRRYASR